MKTIVITGASGSGKSYLSNRLYSLFDNSIVIKTDSYYRDNILIRFLSIFLYDIYDRLLSIKKKEIKNTIRCIYNQDRLISFSNYDFKKKKSSQSEINMKYKGENQFLILEGIFSHRLDLNNKDTINIVCEEQKYICFKRRLKRDKLERDRNTEEVSMKFNRSWYLFYKNIKNFKNRNDVITLNPADKISYNKLIVNLKNKSNKKNQEK